jgi:hypothetical protein
VGRSETFVRCNRLMPEQPYQHHDERNQEQDDRNPVHPVHELRVRIPYLSRIALFDVEILQYLAPDAFHGTNIRYFYALWEIY